MSETAAVALISEERALVTHAKLGWSLTQDHP